MWECLLHDKQTVQIHTMHGIPTSDSHHSDLARRVWSAPLKFHIKHENVSTEQVPRHFSYKIKGDWFLAVFICILDFGWHTHISVKSQHARVFECRVVRYFLRRPEVIQPVSVGIPWRSDLSESVPGLSGLLLFSTIVSPSISSIESFPTAQIHFPSHSTARDLSRGLLLMLSMYQPLSRSRLILTTAVKPSQSFGILMWQWIHLCFTWINEESYRHPDKQRLRPCSYCRRYPARTLYIVRCVCHAVLLDLPQNFTNTSAVLSREHYTPEILSSFLQSNKIPSVVKNLLISPTIFDELVRAIEDKMTSGIYEECGPSFRSWWFCVLGKDGTSMIVYNL